MLLVANSALARFRIDFDEQIEVGMLRRSCAKLQHLRKCKGGVDVQNGKRNLSEKGFAGKPDENVGILSHRPWHGDIFERVIRLAKNENALVLQLVEMRAVQFGHDRSLIEGITKLAPDEHRFMLGSSVCSFRNLCFIRVNLWLVFSCESGA